MTSPEGGSTKLEIDRVLKLLNLEHKRYAKPSAISGGMKRNLQIAIAFIGGSMILILDEPSSGLDVETRRVIWDMLLAVRRKYLILITTHHMEEADCVGDRMAIISQGEVKCVNGISVFDPVSEYRKAVGYCPQFDAFGPNLTGREMLYLFARLRGYRGTQLRDAVEKMIQFVDLQDYASFVADNYSGGNKRNLSIGIAIIGFPSLLFPKLRTLTQLSLFTTLKMRPGRSGMCFESWRKFKENVN